MACVYQRGERFEVVVVLDADVRRTVRLGKVTRKVADRAAVHVQCLADARRQNVHVKDDTRAWVDALSPTMFDRLVRAGLVDARERQVMPTVREWVEGYIGRRTEVAQQTRDNWKRTTLHLYPALGDKQLDEVTPADALDFKGAMVRKGLAVATWSKWLRNTRMFFADALQRELISRNPFAGVKAPQQANRERIQYVDEATITTVLDALPNTRWKVIVALVRWAGLRCPSEVFSLTWADVNFEQRLLTVRSRKGEAHGKGVRLVPIDTRLLPLLVRAFDEAPEGAVHVVENFSGQYANLRTTFEKYVIRAGVTPWPRLMHQLRSSRCIDWAREHPQHVVSEWAGHEAATAALHYLKVTRTDMEKANGIADEKARQNARQQQREAPGTTANLLGFPIGLSEHFAVLLGDALPEQIPERSRQGSNL